MGLYEDAQEDARSILGDADTGFAVSIILTHPNAQTATVNGLHTKHHLNVDSDGRQVSGKNASIAVSEAEILTANPNFPTRNIKNEADMKNVKVRVKDSTGSICLYIINVVFADEALGMFTCILGDFE
jgi:hypothetical protein